VATIATVRARTTVPPASMPPSASSGPTSCGQPDTGALQATAAHRRECVDDPAHRRAGALQPARLALVRRRALAPVPLAWSPPAAATRTSRWSTPAPLPCNPPLATDARRRADTRATALESARWCRGELVHHAGRGRARALKAASGHRSRGTASTARRLPRLQPATRPCACTSPARPGRRPAERRRALGTPPRSGHPHGEGWRAGIEDRLARAAGPPRGERGERPRLLPAVARRDVPSASTRTRGSAARPRARRCSSPACR
jgi:hypothetical protein